jgi:hypothetical protein
MDQVRKEKDDGVKNSINWCVNRDEVKLISGSAGTGIVSTSGKKNRSQGGKAAAGN